ncbi:hypothetical protein ACH4A7_36345 [Streptomyces cyaneofuscatus]|uniref:hypothetical protein n=1 Tax=Streptomyces cyaneofuscatus TaxID=66883 RepID=UPI0037AD9276
MDPTRRGREERRVGLGGRFRVSARGESAELAEARKRIRLLEHENKVLRRAAAYLSQANLPAK